MHENRKNYDLFSYQKKIRNNARKLGIVLETSLSGSFYIFHPIPSCPWLPETRKKYYGKLRKRAQNIPNHKQYTFCTLTYSTRFYTAEKVAQRLKSDIDKFFKRLNYRKIKPEYFYVIELTKQDYCHIHLIFDRYVYWKKIKASWFGVTGSNVIKISAINSKNVFYYITKYTTDSQKQTEKQFAFLFKNVDRLYTFSRNFCIKSDDSNSKNTFLFSFFSPEFPKFSVDSFQTITNFQESDVYMLYLACLERKKQFLMHENKNFSILVSDVYFDIGITHIKAPRLEEILFEFQN